MTITAEIVAELAKGCEGVTPGPWIRSGVRRKIHDQDCLMVGPDGFMIAAIPVGRRPNEHAGAFRDAGFIAACDPQTILSLCKDWMRMKEALERIASISHTGDGSRTFDDQMRDLSWIDDWCRVVLHPEGHQS